MSNPQWVVLWGGDPGLSKKAGWASFLQCIGSNSCLQVSFWALVLAFFHDAQEYANVGSISRINPSFFFPKFVLVSALSWQQRSPQGEYMSTHVKKRKLSFPLSCWLVRGCERWTPRWLWVQSCIPALETSMRRGTQIIGFLSAVGPKGSGQRFHFLRTGARRNWMTQRREGR